MRNFARVLPLVTASAGMLSFPASAQAAEFSGPRLEVDVGLDRVRFDLGTYDVAGRLKSSGIRYGGAVGYDALIGGNLVAGVEAGVDFSNNEQTFDDGTSMVTLRQKRDVSLSARLGTLISPHTLLYGQAGYTNLRVGSETSIGTVVGSDNRTLNGYRLGAGVEQSVGTNTYVKAEYRYSAYENDVKDNAILTGFGIRF